jgi:hypothetical protein
MTGKTLVLYTFNVAYYRVEYFIKHAVFQAHDVDFWFIISDGKDSCERYGIPEYARVIHRDNRGFDFGAWSDALLGEPGAYAGYDRFIFVNSSVIGPILPSYYKGRWTDIYLDGLRDGIRLFGSSINFGTNPRDHAHVQSYIFTMDLETLEHLIGTGIFTKTTYFTTHNDAIQNQEIKMSRDVLAKGWNIGSLLNCFRGVDFRFRDTQPSDYKHMDLHHEVIRMARYLKYWNEYELVFIKGNRLELLPLLRYHFPERFGEGKQVTVDREGKILC